MKTVHYTMQSIRKAARLQIGDVVTFQRQDWEDRHKMLNLTGIVSELYPNFFVIRYSRKGNKNAEISFTYTDIITDRAVKKKKGKRRRNDNMTVKMHQEEIELIYCNNCQKQIYGQHVVSKTKRKTEIHICNNCIKEMIKQN